MVFSINVLLYQQIMLTKQTNFRYHQYFTQTELLYSTDEAKHQKLPSTAKSILESSSLRCPQRRKIYRGYHKVGSSKLKLGVSSEKVFGLT